MSKNKTDKDGTALPKPVVLTPEEVQQVAAAAAATLPPRLPGSMIHLKGIPAEVL
jgi:hypothetical protein